MTLVEKLIVLAVLAALSVGGWFALTEHYVGVGYAKRAAEDEAVTRQQQDRNRDLQRAAELRYTVQAAARDHFIVSTVTEVRNATTSLAACPVGPAGVRLLNDAASCAREDRPASCGAGQPVPGSS